MQCLKANIIVEFNGLPSAIKITQSMTRNIGSSLMNNGEATHESIRLTR